MNYYKKIDFKCASLIKDYVNNLISSTLVSGETKKVISKIIELPDNILAIVNQELSLLGISNVEYCRIYLWPKKSIQFTHVDNGLHCAINIPLRGGENSLFRWWAAEFKTRLVDIIGTGQTVEAIEWLTARKLAQEIEIKDGCYLIRIDQPHQAVMSETSDRWMFTMRFKGNPTFEELYDRLPHSNIE